MNELDCPSALPALHRYVDGECPPGERTAVEVHLASCPDCRMTLRSLRREADLLSMAAGRGEPPGDLFERVQARLPSRRALFFIRHRTALVAAAAVLVLAVLGMVAGDLLDGAPEPVAVVYTTGSPEARAPDGGPWEVIRGERTLEPGSVVRAASSRLASLEFKDWTQLTLREGSRLAVLGQKRGTMHWWRLERGELWAVFGQGRFRVDTAAGSVGGEGCELAIRVSGRPLARAAGFWPSAYAEEPGEIPRTTVVVLRGTAQAWNRHGTVEVRTGMETRLEPGRAPMAPRPAAMMTAPAWTQPPVSHVALAPAPAPLPGPGPVAPPPFEEARVAEPAIVAPRIAMPTPERPPIVVEEVEGPAPGPPTDVLAEATVGRSVAITWKAPTQGAPAAAYKIWRKAKGEDSYKQITVPPLAASKPGERMAHYDHDIAHGMTYTYRVSAVDALKRDGPMGPPVPVKARDFQLSYRGGSADMAMIYVTRRVGNSWETHPFRVRKRDKAKGHSGAIGSRVRKELGRGPRTVDFRTGYVLVDIIEERHPATGKMIRHYVVLETEDGRREHLEMPITRSNGK